MAIGYNMRLTPLQMTTFYNAIANDGKMVAPFLVKEVRRGGKTIRSYGTEVLNKRICSGSTVKAVRAMMEGVASEGTAYDSFKTSKLKMAGKTGTTLKVVGSAYQKKYQASFCGYFPADEPKYTLFILIDEPQGGAYYGSSVAAPAFRTMAEQIWAMDMDFAPVFQLTSEDTVRNPVTRKVNKESADAVYGKLNISTPSEAETRWVNAEQQGKAVQYTEMNIKSGKMPDVRGMSSRDALHLLENMDKMGLRVTLIGNGKVRTQSIPTGTPLESRMRVILELR
jgi:cell division protein FtsI (penicillin-binding protein 3)